MKFRLFFSGFAFLSLSLSLGTAQTAPLYINSSRVQSPPDPAPQIDAEEFINEGYFEVNGANVYQTANTLRFRNTASGTMFGHPGYFFEYIFGNTRSRMSTWRNDGSISSVANPENFFFFVGPNWLWVSSESIVNPGSLNASAQGMIHLDGNTINLSRGRLRAGDAVESTFFRRGTGGVYLYDTNGYFIDLGISDLYWGGGSNNVVSGNGPLMALDSFTPNFSVADLRSAVHEVIQPSFGGLFTNQMVLPSFSFFGPKGVTASAHRSTNGNQIFVQVVFVATNFFDTNLTTDVKFFPDFSDGGATVQVGFHSADRDVALDTTVTNSLYVIDGLAFRTNVTLVRNRSLGANTRRPDTYDVTKAPFGFFGQSGNTTYTNTLLYDPLSYATNAVPVTYAAYSAQLATQSGTGDPTNFAGRVEIFGQNVNMNQARVRAESTFILTANNLVSNSLARASAPFMSFDVGTTQPQLIVSNLAPSSVNRLFGTVSAWSAIWDNTNTAGTAIRFHVLVVDHNLQTFQPVTMSKFFGRGPGIVLHDSLNVNQRLRLDATSLHIKPSGGLTFPPNWSWGASNVVNVMNYTNEGFVTVPGIATLGPDKGSGYANVINRGSHTAQLLNIASDYFENSGSMAALSGYLRANGRSIALRGQPIRQETIITTNFIFFPVFSTNYVTNTVFAGAATLTSRGDLTLGANSISLSNALLQAGNGVPGAIIINATNRLTDSGPQRTNYWITTGGIRVMKLPAINSDLMGTYAVVRAAADSEVRSIWDGKNLGPTVIGYSNNLALGKLTLDGGEGSVFRFSGTPGKDNAIYVDYLELLNNATNLSALALDSNIKIYFAHANIAARHLDDGTPTSRLRWVRGFMGPLSTTNITYPSGNVYPVNISLAQHPDIDSDGDGTPNSKDRTPVYTAESISLRIERDVQPDRALLSWRAVQGSTSHIEFKPTVSTAPWQLLRSTNAPASMRLNTTDTTTGRTQRIYRVRVDLPAQ
jgi:hypothetical protein